MRGNTNANTSGGGGSVGNESALDLLIAQNTAKANLATNLQGKGIEANATTETLNELVNKVPNILTDNSQTFPECLTLNLTINPLTIFNLRPIIEVNGYFIFLNISSTASISYLSYIKKSDIENAMIDNTSVSLSSLILNSASLASQNIYNYTQLCLTPDNNKIYLWDTTSNHHIRAFDINWSGEDITSITEDTNINININIGTGDQHGNLVYRDNQLLMSSSTGIYLYDLTTSTKTTLKSATLPRGSYSFIIWYQSDEFIYGYIENSKLTIEVYSLSGTTITLLDTIYGSTINISSGWVSVYNKIKIIGSKVLIPLEQSTTYSGIKFAIYDTENKTLAEYTNAKTVGLSIMGNNPSQYQNNINILHLENENRYIIAVGYIFYIFDESFNLINSVNVNTNNISTTASSTFLYATLFWLGDKMISFNGTNVISIPYWYGKKTIIKKVNSINEQTKEMYYPADEISVADIEAGYYD